MTELRKDARVTIHATIMQGPTVDGKERTVIHLTPEPDVHCSRFLSYTRDSGGDRLQVHGQNMTEINTVHAEDIPFFINALKFAEEFLLKK